MRFSIEKLREEQNYPYQIDSRLISREKKTRKTAKNIQITAWKDFIEATPTQTRPDMKCQSNTEEQLNFMGKRIEGKTNWETGKAWEFWILLELSLIEIVDFGQLLFTLDLTLQICQKNYFCKISVFD